MNSVKSFQAFASTIPSEEIGLCPYRRFKEVMMLRKRLRFVSVGDQMKNE